MKKMNLYVDDELYKKAQYKSKTKYYLPLNKLIKIFLLSFVKARGFGFYIGDEDLDLLIRRRLSKQEHDHVNKGC